MFHGGIILKVEFVKTSCIYFSSYFYKTFEDVTRIKDDSILKNHLLREALCYCTNCRNKIKKYLRRYDTLSHEFFFRQGNF